MRLQIAYWKTHDGQITAQISVDKIDDYKTASIFLPDDNLTDLQIHPISTRDRSYVRETFADAKTARFAVGKALGIIGIALVTWRAIETPRDQEVDI